MNVCVKFLNSQSCIKDQKIQKSFNTLRYMHQ